MSRKSTGGSALFPGRHLLRAASSTQSRIATLSAELGYYVLARALSVAMVHGIADQAGMALAAPLALCDASVVLALAQEPGLGRTKHIALATLWIQQRVRAGDADLLKVGTKNNLADCLTKDAPREGQHFNH